MVRNYLSERDINAFMQEEKWFVVLVEAFQTSRMLIFVTPVNMNWEHLTFRMLIFAIAVDELEK